MRMNVFILLLQKRQPLDLILWEILICNRKLVVIEGYYVVALQLLVLGWKESFFVLTVILQTGFEFFFFISIDFGILQGTSIVLYRWRFICSLGMFLLVWFYLCSHQICLPYVLLVLLFLILSGYFLFSFTNYLWFRIFLFGCCAVGWQFFFREYRYCY